MRRRTGADELTHSAGSIRITTTHVAPPWASTHLLLRSGNAAVRVGASMFVRGKLLDALRDAGVTVDEESSPSGATN
jgi:hypothetical protein